MGMGLGDAVSSVGGSGIGDTIASMAVPMPVSLLNGIVTALGLQAPNHVSPGQFMSSMFSDLGSLPGVLSAAFQGFPGNVTHSTDMSPTNAPGGVGGNNLPAQLLQQMMQPQQPMSPFGGGMFGGMSPFGMGGSYFGGMPQFPPMMPQFNPMMMGMNPMMMGGMNPMMMGGMNPMMGMMGGMGSPWGMPQMMSPYGYF